MYIADLHKFAISVCFFRAITRQCEATLAVLHHLRQIHTTTPSTLTLVTHILILKPLIPALSPARNVDFNLNFVTLNFRLLSLAMRRDLEVPLASEVVNGISTPMRKNVSHLALKLCCRKGNNEYDTLKRCWCSAFRLVRTFHFVSALLQSFSILF